MKRRRSIVYVDDLITTGTNLSSLSRVVACEGDELEIQISKVSPRRWSLEVVNARDVRSMWTRYFNSDENALRAALKAIAAGGPEDFDMDLPYLYELH